MARTRRQIGEERAYARFDAEYHLPYGTSQAWYQMASRPGYHRLRLRIGNGELVWPNGQPILVGQVLHPRRPTQLRWVAELDRHIRKLLDKYSPGWKMSDEAVAALVAKIHLALADMGRRFG